MSNSVSNDPRAVRSRLAFQEAFTELLQIKPFHKITVSDIASKAGFARHTFYNHYETKEDLLSTLIDVLLSDFFEKMKTWDFSFERESKEIEMYTLFFQVWKDNYSLSMLINKLDISSLLIERLKLYFARYYYEVISGEIPGASDELAKYIISFNSYTLLSILKPWLQDGMPHSAEVVAGLLQQLTSSLNKKMAVEKYKSILV